MFLIIGLVPATLRAQTPPDAAATEGEEKARARVYFERAETLKHSGSARAEAGDMDGARAAYAEAATVYLRAFELFPHAAFMYNVGQMHRLSGKSAKAIRAYERYLDLDPGGDKAEDARAHIAALRRGQAPRPGTAGNAGEPGAEDAAEDAGEDADEDAGEDADEDADETDGADEDLGAAGAGDELPSPSAAASELDDEGEREDTGGPLRIGGLVAAGVGVIAFGAGIKYGLDAQDIADELSGPRFMWTVEDRERFAEGERAERNALILMGIGGAALVTGGVLFLVGHDRDGSEAEDSGLGVSASATSDSASMLLWGRF